MSTKTPTGQNDCGIELPSNWTRTRFRGQDEQAFEQLDGDALVRITREIPLESAAACNEARHTDDQGKLVVLVNDEPLPSEPEYALDGGSVEAAIEAAKEAMQARSPQGVTA